jgi:hypothetical protein
MDPELLQWVPSYSRIKIMKKFALLAASAALLSSTIVSTANANQVGMDDRQKFIQSQMEMLSQSQNMMQLEIQSHFKRAQAIQSYQMCIQASSTKDNFRLCKMKLKKDQNSLDAEFAALRKDNR